MTLWPVIRRLRFHSILQTASHQRIHSIAPITTKHPITSFILQKAAMSSNTEQIKEISAKLKALKTANGDKEEIEKLTNQLKEMNKKKGGADGGAAGKKFELKTPKGTKDFTPEEMAVREKIFSTITEIFKRHGAVTIDTPVFELKDILTGKYGEDSKLIYDLQDQGGELCSLRYDLTVPFARFLAANSNIASIKRYHIAKVYRRDNPSVNKGRMREFYQCDLDIAGDFGAMIPDSEVLRIMVELLDKLEVGPYVVKLNNRKILDGMFEVCGVPSEKLRQISSAVDKLDKMSWEDVKKEMTVEKGLPADVADRIGEYVKLSGGAELCDTLLADPKLSANASAKSGVEDMRLLFKYLEIFGVTHRMSFDLSLARGLDYYTGVIYEAVLTANTDETSGVGSIASGGRYDELVGMFSGKKIPCVGISIGLERVFAILFNRLKKSSQALRTTSTQVYIVGLGTGFLPERMLAAKELWDAGVSAEFAYKEKPRRDQQFKAAAEEQIPVIVVLDGEKVESGNVQIEDSVSGEKVVVKRDEMVATVKKILKL
ncbi:Cytoplasmic and mitochondrial histidine tRNA synthetase [Phlyctochytrium planicorne]|nr:Cytoplasmic and mitochondrial histidine tRNA synthetase [Phlyctochytrium planicorne]